MIEPLEIGQSYRFTPGGMVEAPEYDGYEPDASRFDTPEAHAVIKRILAERAQAEGISVSAYIARLLERDAVA